jgi:hypothetical protein
MRDYYDKTFCHTCIQATRLRQKGENMMWCCNCGKDYPIQSQQQQQSPQQNKITSRFQSEPQRHSVVVSKSQRSKRKSNIVDTGMNSQLDESDLAYLRSLVCNMTIIIIKARKTLGEGPSTSRRSRRLSKSY